MGKIRHQKPSKKPEKTPQPPPEEQEVADMEEVESCSNHRDWSPLYWSLQEMDNDDADDDGDDRVEEHNQADFDKRSVVSNKTIKSLVSKKKDKILLKRQFLLKRAFVRSFTFATFSWTHSRLGLHAEHESKREAKERAERRKTVIVSDMKHEFETSLGQIESYLEEQRLALSLKKTTKKQIPSQAERNRQR